jgi:hypothetical protein
MGRQPMGGLESHGDALSSSQAPTYIYRIYIYIYRIYRYMYILG